MEIIHLSDLHFGDAQAPFNERELSEALSTYILENTDNPIVVISGDITIKGQACGYEIASTFVGNLMSLGKVNKENLCVCPGNHDIVDGGFQAFDRFVYGLRRDHSLDFSNDTYKVIAIQDILFVVLNSSYHLNHTFGLVDDRCFDVDLSEYSDMKKILVFHHHILNQFDGDTSAIRNGYDLVQFIEKNRFCLALHGHQHTEQLYHLGKSSTPVISARSGNFEQSGYLNAFNHYKVTNDEVLIDSFVFEKARRGVKIMRLTR
ncbi:metallophosphoesterase family protein [Vibrio splendidus]|uniref:metallophosphoesterase family protein n=1 Tax=Vibrio splendidus TaxID=29497 RepID=UPI00076AC911|nr:metallophosphoesterase [Vibrio splendidus]PHX03529.1 3',5'-cyclic adenosine monophosphate phosphodiesterase CpdA [Vibrio splendidus]